MKENGAREKAVIFDMDGVLIDSAHVHFKSWQLLGEELDVVFTEEQFVKGFGRTSREVLVDDWPEKNLSERQIEERDQKKEEYFRQLLEQEFPCMEGALELFRKLYEEGFQIGIGSSGPSENVRFTIKKMNLQKYLTAYVTGSDVTLGKPDPEIFNTVANKLEIANSNCIVIEDAVAGIKAAHAAGMKCIGFVSSGHTHEELSEADLLIDSLHELTVDKIDQLLQ
jgi:beta-phosphoglucomutase family hydrolase